MTPKSAIYITKGNDEHPRHVYGYVGLCMALCMAVYGYVWLCRVMYAYGGLCSAIYGYVGLCRAM